MAYLDNFDAECECGNGISYREMGDGAVNCEWCEYPSMDWVMWRRRGDWLEQMETHGFDALYRVELTGGKSVSVWANSQEIAEYIALEADAILEEL